MVDYSIGSMANEAMIQYPDIDLGSIICHYMADDQTEYTGMDLAATIMLPGYGIISLMCESTPQSRNLGTNDISQGHQCLCS